ncbi:atp4 subunit B of the stator stalk of mitochondrial F1F0 ATP synthase [Puccinia graminis f. sp. tritici]|uniref:ATP synthase subunit 4 n=1 Tax=Puccinia graminis f. sp. tritici TaxID=56615 RepID=A0A5B0N2S6_PUCGR|nr:atp4 subunit B of the stator stalk of mitochondrial F1F0 ATP synthase [Puccinia graminis f. sp. tritici]KAA1093967.1 atp4 subunit B of the stator stalk of mitochondrial F1F0 ATP synthase [Puccinia graminis f. sp. tritici]
MNQLRPLARRLALNNTQALRPLVLPAATSIRFNSTTTAPTDPKAKANAFLDALPGNSAISKTGWVTLAASLGGYAVSNELYVVNEESVILAGFVIMVGYLSTVIKEPYKQWADSVIEKQRSVLNASRTEHTNAVKERIASVSEMKDVVSVTKTLFEMSRDTAVTEHELHKMKQKMAVKDEIKSILDGWVRVETQAREAEQAELVKQVVSSVQKQLEDPKLQKEIMSNSIAEIEALIKDKKI